MQKLPSSMPRYVKSASFLQFHVVLCCSSVFSNCSLSWSKPIMLDYRGNLPHGVSERLVQFELFAAFAVFLRSFAAKSPKVQKLLNFGRSRHSLGIAFYKLSTFRVVERPLKIESHFVARELESRRRRTKGSVSGRGVVSKCCAPKMIHQKRFCAV